MSEPLPDTCDVTLVVPIADPDSDVREVVRTWSQVLEKAGKSWEALLVYDGVQGDAWSAGLAMQAQTSDQVRTIALHRPMGEAVCLQSAFHHARGSSVLTAPDYIQVDPEALAPMLEVQAAGADLVTARREERVDSAPARAQSWIFNAILRAAVGAPFHDLNCPVRLIRRELIDELTIYGNMYRFLPVIAWRQGYRVEELGAKHLAEIGPKVLFGFGAYVRRALDVLGILFLTRFTHKPLRFFGALGGVCLLIGSALAGGLAIRKAMVPDYLLFDSPLFLLGVLLIVLGAQVIGFGLVGEIIIFTQAKNVREYRIERIHE